LFYNKTFVQTLPTSINDLLNANQKYPVSGGSPLVFDAGNFYHEGWLHFGLGGGIFNGTNYKDVSPIKNAGAVKAFQALLDMKTKGVMPATLPDYGTAMSLFTNNKAAFFVTGPWEYANLKKALGDKMGVMVIPGGKPFVTIESTMLSKYAKNKDAALEFMKFLTGGINGQSSYNAAAYLGKTIGHVPASVNAYSDSGVANDPIIKVFSAQAAKGVPIPNAPEMQAVWSVVNQILPTVYQGKLTPANAAAQAYQQITEQIKK
jgi:maltose-binding protein MalE